MRLIEPKTLMADRLLVLTSSSTLLRPMHKFAPEPDTYGHLIPGADVSYVDLLDRKSAVKSTFEQQLSATPAQPGVVSETPVSAYVVEFIGGGRQDRTADLRVINPSL